MSAEYPEIIGTLTRVLVRACRKLGEAGQPRVAGHLAAYAWVVLRTKHPRQAQHLNGAMHYLALLEQNADKSAPSTQKDPPNMATTDRVLDVRTEVPKKRHELIFDAFSELAPGTSYLLVNDHDPKPLKYQFDAEHSGEFGWEYIEEGPEVWRVRISRIAKPDATTLE